MSIYYLSHDPKNCINCYSCEVHCKTKNRLPVGPRFCQIMSVGPKLVKGIPKLGSGFYALLPLRKALVCGRLSYRGDAKKGEGRHSFC